jgi:DNA (cytosine-5)-methyltransferase 1
MNFTTLELCAGGGGQALGFEMAGFHHAAVVEYEPQFCTTLRTNRPHWRVIQDDIRNLLPRNFTGLALLTAVLGLGKKLVCYRLNLSIC